MKYLVTGGAGFIGSHLVERLLSEGNDVKVVDDFHTGKRENLKPNRRLVVYPISILNSIQFFFQDVDIVFHLAALTRPQVSILYPEETTQVNIDGTLAVIKSCIDNGVKRLVFASSSSVYGEQTKFPESEDAVPNVMSPYALTKLVGEQYCKLYEKLNGLKTNCVRPFNVFGARQNPEGGYSAAVPNFIKLLSQNKTPNITGDGEQRRDFTYVDDVVDLMIKAAETDVYGEVFNAGTGHNHSVNELYKTISDIMGKTIKPNYIEAVVEPYVFLADTSKSRKLLGWEPKVSFEDGLERTIKETLI